MLAGGALKVPSLGLQTLRHLCFEFRKITGDIEQIEICENCRVRFPLQEKLERLHDDPLLGHRAATQLLVVLGRHVNAVNRFSFTFHDNFVNVSIHHGHADQGITRTLTKRTFT